MQLSRRHFLYGAAALSSGWALGTTVSAGLSFESPAPTPSCLYKGMILPKATEEDCAKLKAAGYDGIEINKWDISIDEARAQRAIAEKHELRIHSVMRGWAKFNDKDEAVRRQSIEETATAIRVAAAVGADAVLLVPCRTDVKPRPEAWDFAIDFDPKTLRVRSVAKGDNGAYADYIRAQNEATAMSAAAIRELIPLAAGAGVRIAVENVWNNLWCTPEYFAAFIKHFDNPWIGCYFDLGNHTKYSRAEAWLEALGSTIVKMHIKGFKVTEVKNERGGGPGNWTAVDQGSIDWKSVRRAVHAIGYNGYVSVEENKYDFAKYSEVLETFFKY